MATIIIKDANEKAITVDLGKIQDINGDTENGFSSGISDALKNRVSVVRDIQYVDQTGNVIDSTQLLKDVASGKTKVYALDVEMEGTHSGKNHNYCVYYEDSMEKDAESFMNPFHKPMLKNHDSYSEPLGRMKVSAFGPSALTDERSAIHLTVRVTDADAIPKFLDGRYRTVSIGGTMGTVTCNICGKTILKDGKFNFCGHWRGETYKDQVCYWGARDIEYHEVSVVNNPADDFAQIVKITVVTDAEAKKEENNSKEEGAGTMGDVNKTTVTAKDVNSADFRTQLINVIDSVLGAGVSEAADQGTGEATATATEIPAAATDGAADGQQTATDNVDVTKLQQELADANTKIGDLNTQLQEAKDSAEKANSEKEEAVQDAAAFKDQCIMLSIANKSLIAEKVADLEVKGGKITEDQRDERVKELTAKSMKDLKAAEDEVKTNGGTATQTTDGQQRTMATQVANPTLANTDEKGAVVVAEDGTEFGKNKTTDNNKTVESMTSVDDFVDNIVGKLIK